ncbi:uncharacterized protein BCR38DRAFT_381327 [Pseudomassariella vexata]|uniref:C2H2-type domain-containing protein n=1 Tax=Pseudomassariella vexata TaxID=1141098 RepID=A0A1Y2EHP4_9PEZI|nr:uncharacterized protein BCR38DRAFT_381327 [Pseudomassariella vexata]ORY71088.1 hypothetical protein BCR38DRAFT_381327 [Pseudomassariella vexata]
MEKGIDELIEWLLDEIAFSGLEGFSALHLVKAVKAFYNCSVDSSEGDSDETLASVPDWNTVLRQEVDEQDFQHASTVWKWLASRNDVSVGPNRQFNCLSLEEVLAIPEKEDKEVGTAAVTSDQPPPTTAHGVQSPKSRKSKNSSNIRPSLYLSEERLWNALAGHRPDLKRIPQFEWRALVAIASVKGKGILQGDLVRLTGQDKRSLPTRTDALAKKGYIIKQPAMLRGCRTSKLWLARFAGNAEAESSREGLPIDELDLSPETLTKDGLKPVPFSHYYTGEKENVDYLAMGQAFVAVAKAFGIMRYCDLRVKMGVAELNPQMRALANSSRWFAHIKVIKFTAGQFPGSAKVFQDCIEFLRDPTSDEWRSFRTTPKTRMSVPSTRRGKQGASQVEPTNALTSKVPRGYTKRKRELALLATLPGPELIKFSAWTPYKPIQNTLFDIIKRSGKEGTSNVEVQLFTAGHPYRKWVAALMSAISRPHPANPPAFSVTSQLTRIGKTMTYQYFTSDLVNNADNTRVQEITENNETETTEKQSEVSSEQKTSENNQMETVEQEGEVSSEQSNLNGIVTYGFQRPTSTKFLASGATSLAQIVQGKQSGKPIRRLVNTGHALGRTSTEYSGQTPRRRGRPRKSVQVEEPAGDSLITAEDLPQSLDNQQTPDTRRRLRRPHQDSVADEFSQLVDEESRSLNEQPSAVSRLRRGRPRKQFLIDEPSDYSEEPMQPSDERPSTTTTRRRGRPPKKSLVDEPSDCLDEAPKPSADQTSTAGPRKHILDEVLNPVQEPRPRGRPPKRTRMEDTAAADTEEWHPRGNISLAKYYESKKTKVAISIGPEELTVEESCQAWSRGLSGVYYGYPSSIGPKSRGRQKESLVMQFRFPALRNPDFLGRSPGDPASSANTTAPEVTASVSPDTNGEDTSATQMDNLNTVSENGSKVPDGKEVDEDDDEPDGGTSRVNIGRPKNCAKRGRKTAANGGKPFKCDKCGGTWKNINGLEYHQQKSKTPCNPDYVALPPKPVCRPGVQTKSTRELESDEATDTDEHGTVSLSGSSRNAKSKQMKVKAERTRVKRMQTELPTRRPSLAFAPSPSPTERTSIRPPFRNSALLGNMTVFEPIRLDKELGRPPAAKHGTPTPIFQSSDERSQRQSNSPLKMASLLDTPRSIQKAIDGTSIGSSAQKPVNGIDNRKSSAKHSVHVNDNREPSSDKLTKVTGGMNTSAIDVDQAESGPNTLCTSAPLNHDTPSPSKAAIVPSSNQSQELQGEIASLSDPNKSKSGVAPLQHARSLKGTSKTPAAQRRERTADIVLELMERNSGVFPGDRSLYLMIASIWAQKFHDIGPPDWRTHQNIIKKLAEAQIIKQEFFGFFDSSGKTKFLSMIYKVYPDDVESNHTEIIEVRNQVRDKIKELYPEPYIPAGFELSHKESELFDAVALKYRETSPPADGITQNKAREVAVLRYNVPMDKYGRLKRPLVTEDQDENHLPKRTKRETIASNDTATPTTNKKGERARKSQNKLQECHDDSKMAKFIWSRKHGQWQQSLSCLQNPNTGAWSHVPGKFGAGNIDNFIASVKQVFGCKPVKRRRRKRQNTKDVESEPANGDTVVPAQHKVGKASVSWNLDELVPEVQRAMDASTSVQILEPSTAATFVPCDVSDNDDDDDFDTVPQQADPPENEDPTNDQGYRVRFTRIQKISAIEDGLWPMKYPKPVFRVDQDGSYTMDGHFPSLHWFLRQNLPQSAEEMAEKSNQKLHAGRWADNHFRRFMRQVTGIETWELSAEGVYLQYRGTIAPDYIYISLGANSSMVSMQPMEIEWPSDFQYTSDMLPADIKDASSDDDRIPYEHRPAEKKRKTRHITTYPRAAVYTTRTLMKIPTNPRGRWNRHRAVGDGMGLEGEKEMIVAFVVLKHLIGGVDKLADYGLLVKLFPQMSVSGLKKFWTRVSKERRSFIDALSTKFQSEFLKAYEKDELPTINYDDLENYDWKTVITWACNLETHERIQLPVNSEEFHKRYMLVDRRDGAENWRESWFKPTSSVFSRIDASSSEAMTMPVASATATNGETQLARSWIRSLCNNSRKNTVGQEIRDALLQLSQREPQSLNALLERVVQQLMDENVVSKVRGKGLGQVFKLNQNFQKRLDAKSHVVKYARATAFKAEMDDNFRNNREVVLPYNMPDGESMAVLNLHACGRVRLEDVDLRHIPFGFEPGNYEGRMYPKTYYHFFVRVVPTESYIYDDDLPILDEAKIRAVPEKGPRGEIPIWYDFFGNLDKARWAQYLCAVAFVMATRGPLKSQTVVMHLRPIIEDFEAKLVMDWLVRLGLLQAVADGHGWIVAEWWWLVVGRMLASQF